MKQTKVTCDATDGANAQICVLGFLPNDNGVSLIDLTQNRLHGTLLQYGPNGGAAHALKQYEHKSGHFPLIFVVEVTQSINLVCVLSRLDAHTDGGCRLHLAQSCPPMQRGECQAKCRHMRLSHTAALVKVCRRATILL